MSLIINERYEGLKHLNELTAEKLFYGELTRDEMLLLGIDDPENSGFKIRKVPKQDSTSCDKMINGFIRC